MNWRGAGTPHPPSPLSGATATGGGMSDCAHLETVPVETFDPLDGGAGPVVAVVARLCVACHAQLPVAWGCRDCEWAEVGTFGSLATERLLTRPCEEHR